MSQSELSQQRLQYQIAEEQRKWDLLSEKLSRFEKEKILTADIAQKFRLEHQIAAIRNERREVEQRLENLENQFPHQTHIDYQRLFELIELLHHPDFRVRNLAIDKIVQIGDIAIPILEHLLYDDGIREAVIEIFVRFEDSSIPILIEALNADNASVCANAAAALARIGDAAIAPLIRIALSPTSRRGRPWAVRALAQINDTRLRSVFHQLLQDENGLVRKYAALGLERLSFPEDIDALEESFKQENSLDIRIATINALAHTGDSQAANLLIDLIAYSDHSIRIAAISALGNFSHQRAIEALRNVVYTSENAQLRDAAIEALAHIGADAVPYLFDRTDVIEQLSPLIVEIFSRMGEPAVYPLLDRLRTGEASEQNLASESLVKLGHVAVRPIVEEYVYHSNLKKEAYGFMGREHDWNVQYSAIVLNMENILLKIGRYSIIPLMNMLKSARTAEEEEQYQQLLVRLFYIVLKSENTDEEEKRYHTLLPELKMYNVRKPKYGKTAEEEQQYRRLLNQVIYELFKRVRLKKDKSAWPPGIDALIEQHEGQVETIVEYPVPQTEDRDIQIEFPDIAVLEEHYHLTIQVLLPRAEETALSRIAPRKDLDLEVQVSAPGFEVVDGPVRRSIPMVSGEDSPAMIFTLMPKEVGKHEIQVTFLQNKSFLGVVGLVCEVVRYKNL